MSEAQSLDRIKRTIEEEATRGEQNGQGVAGSNGQRAHSVRSVASLGRTSPARSNGTSAPDNPFEPRYPDHTIGVVVPAYNEEGFVGDVLRSIPKYVDVIYAVDDASTDGTWEEILEAARESSVSGILDELPSERKGKQTGTKAVVSDGGSLLHERAAIQKQIGRVVAIRHNENRGAGGAIKTGYLAALQDRIDVTVTLDGDGQMDPEQMPKLLDPIVDGEADYAKGNRLLHKEYRKDMPRFRFVGNAILTFLTKIASGYWKTMDPQNGYTAISRQALENIGVEGMYEYYGYCNEVLVELNTKGMRIADVAMPARYDEERSSISYPAYIRNVSGMLLGNFLRRLNVKYLVLDFHPLALFYWFGALTATVGLAGGVWSVYAKVVLGHPFFVRASLSLTLFLIGSMFLMFAMLFDMQVNEDQELQIRNI